jgi:NADP-dependent 3-hydroxy acid dehydrogenase YdfG
MNPDSARVSSQNVVLHLETNTNSTMRIFEKILEARIDNGFTEIHLTSSLLADFVRPSLFSYSISKFITERYILSLNKFCGKHGVGIFIWKFAFVATKLNENRKKSIISTNFKAISENARKKTKPGVYYIPWWSKTPSKILKHLPGLAEKFK